MLTRLRVRGFKNLVDVEAAFGPLTCIAGPNGVGKSNLLDAISFLGLLADKPFVEAARSVRGGTELGELFTGAAGGEMCFEAEMLIPQRGQDDFRQPAKASNTFLRYELRLAYEEVEPGRAAPARIRLVSERLDTIPKSEAEACLRFSHERAWRDSVVIGASRRTSFIKTEEDADGGVIVRLQSDRMRDDSKDKRGGGRATGFIAATLPRTVLSSAQNAEETRTAVLVRQEMRRWRQLQLEPSALRQPDGFDAEARLDVSGRHVPAALLRLAAEDGDQGARVYAAVANRLARLMDGVRAVRVDRDEARRVLRFMLEEAGGLELPASALSDGTLRFVALAVFGLDTTETGLVCLEEPENGIHPQRVEAMLELLYDMAVDPREPTDATNPLRQVIATTHSPVVAARVFDEDLVFARGRHHAVGGRRVAGLSLQGIEGTWRAEPGPAVSRGLVLSFLGAAPVGSVRDLSPGRSRVQDTVQGQLPFGPAER